MEFISSSEKYYKEIIDEEGISKLIEGSEQEYNQSLKSKASTNWLKMTSTLASKDSRIGTASLRCEWLIRPTFCQTDILGVNVKQGSIIKNTQTGIYFKTYTDGNTKHVDYNSNDVVVTNAGTILKVDLDPGYDKLIAKHVITTKTDFYKESGSEQLTSTYLHQRMSISLSPSFSFTSDGKLSVSGGINIGASYDAAYDNDSISWI